jgi:nicotinamide-nucleotide amidase
MPHMKAAILAVGSEMLGPTRVDTNSLKLTVALEAHGVSVTRKSVVGDRIEDLIDELQHALSRVDILLITGGLGPTEDDLTREALAAAFGLEFDVDQSIVDRIEARFAARGIVMPEVNRKQGNVFRGGRMLYNERGTAPGFQLRVDGKQIWVFPGVPFELEGMIGTYLVPSLAEASGGRARHRRVLKISGLTESGVEERIKPYYDAHTGELVTILASPAAIEVHVIAEGSADEARPVLDAREGELRGLLGERVFGTDDETLESAVGKLLLVNEATLAIAESCTGGLVASRITDVAGSSAYFLGGAVCYTADAKVAIAGVDRELILAHGEVSEEVAVALANGIRERFGSTYGIGVTGIAGPGGGSEAKPVGTVHIAVSSASGVEHRKLFWPAPRHIVKWFSAQSALDLLRLTMLR